MQGLTQTALEGVMWITKGAERAQGEAGLGSAATWGCKPGGPLPPVKPPGKAARWSWRGCWKSKETAVLGSAGKPWKGAPWGLIPDNNPALKKTLLSSLEGCRIALAIVRQRKKSWKDLSSKETPKGKCLFLTRGRLFCLQFNFQVGFFFKPHSKVNIFMAVDIKKTNLLFAYAQRLIQLS